MTVQPDALNSIIRNVTIPQERLADFCRRHHIRKLSLFGSVLHDDFRPDSDVDVLVEFEPNCTSRKILLSSFLPFRAWFFASKEIPGYEPSSRRI